MILNNKILWIDCNCHSPHHAIRVWHQTDENWNELIIEMQVNNHRGFFRRCVEAFKYIFNFKNNNCGYDAFNIHEKDVDPLVDLLQEFKAENAKRIENYNNG